MLILHTQAIELLLGAFEILSPQQSGDVYLAVLHYLITTMRTQASRPPLHFHSESLIAPKGVASPPQVSVYMDVDPMRMSRSLFRGWAGRGRGECGA